MKSTYQTGLPEHHYHPTTHAQLAYLQGEFFLSSALDHFYQLSSILLPALCYQDVLWLDNLRVFCLFDDFKLNFAFIVDIFNYFVPFVWKPVFELRVVFYI